MNTGRLTYKSLTSSFDSPLTAKGNRSIAPPHSPHSKSPRPSSQHLEIARNMSKPLPCAVKEMFKQPI